jgi:3-oxoacyl-[acyl-carrier protein] reductase
LGIARALAAEGAAVTLVGRERSSLEHAAATLNGAVSIVQGGADDEAVVERGVAAARAATGRLDILVNNAGGPPPPGSLVDAPMSQFDTTLSVNLRAPLLWTRAAWKGSMREHGGAILNIGSIAGLRVPAHMGAYAVSKAGLLHMTRCLAAELAPRVRVNAIAPGMVRTDGTSMVDYVTFSQVVPLGRVGETSDVAAAALFLLSDEAGWMTGETLTVDGGSMVQRGQLPRSDV